MISHLKAKAKILYVANTTLHSQAPGYLPLHPLHAASLLFFENTRPAPSPGPWHLLLPRPGTFFPYMLPGLLLTFSGALLKCHLFNKVFWPPNLESSSLSPRTLRTTLPVFLAPCPCSLISIYFNVFIMMICPLEYKPKEGRDFYLVSSVPGAMHLIQGRCLINIC